MRTDEVCMKNEELAVSAFASHARMGIHIGRIYTVP
jgi:hypothetical protein